MRQSSAGSLESIPGSETSSLSDSRDLSRSEEESSIGKLSEQSSSHEKHDEGKDIASPEKASDDVILPSDVPEKDDIITPRDNNVSKSEEEEEKER